MAFHMNLITTKRVFNSLIYYQLFVIWITSAQVRCSDHNDFEQITNELNVEYQEKDFNEMDGTKALLSLKILDSRLKRAYNTSVRRRLYFYPLLWNMSHRFVRKLSDETKDWLKRLRSLTNKKESTFESKESKEFDDWTKHLNKVNYAINELDLILDKFCHQFNIDYCFLSFYLILLIS